VTIDTHEDGASGFPGTTTRRNNPFPARNAPCGVCGQSLEESEEIQLGDGCTLVLEDF
jgi:hypothetical protein